jgi:glucose-1-phosphate adenylyltransferase
MRGIVFALHLMTDTLAIVLGGGQGSRLFPLTATRSKPAVPIGGKYRLIDIPVSGCLHADIRRIYVLTQFNSASLNRHISGTYRLDQFSGGFVEILAAEQTPDNPHWFQGTADAVRQAARHFAQHPADYYLILAGDHICRMDYRALVEAHREFKADVTIAAQAVDSATATQMGIFRFEQDGHIAAFEEKPDRDRLQTIGRSIPEGARFAAHDGARPFTASMGIYVFNRQVLLDLLERESGHDFGRELIPRAIAQHKVRPYLFDGYWADVGTIQAFYDANVTLGRPDAPFRYWDPLRPIYTHLRHLPGSRLQDCQVRDSIVSDGCNLHRCSVDQSVIGLRSRVGNGTRVEHSVVLGADWYEDDPPPDMPRLGIGRDVLMRHVIVDKNARIGDGVRLLNEAGVQHADGNGYCIRSGIIVVPKGGVIAAGTVV